jgi:hypothetical protein
MNEPKNIKEFDALPDQTRFDLSLQGYRVPRTSFDGSKRVLIKLSKEDAKKVPQRGRTAFIEQPTGGTTVTDLITGKQFQYFLASCNLPTCYCDAVVIKAK